MERGQAKEEGLFQENSFLVPKIKKQPVEWDFHSLNVRLQHWDQSGPLYHTLGRDQVVLTPNFDSFLGLELLLCADVSTGKWPCANGSYQHQPGTSM